MFLTRSEYDRGVNTFSPEGRLFQVEYAIEAIKVNDAQHCTLPTHTAPLCLFCHPLYYTDVSCFLLCLCDQLGTTALGLQTSEGVVLAVEKRVTSKLLVPSSIQKLVRLDAHIGCAMSGLVSDARTLVDHARIETQQHWFNYDERMTVESCVQAVCDLALQFGEAEMARPFGVSLLIGGVDRLQGPVLYHTDPSGTYTRYLAKAIGAGSEGAQNALNEQYNKSLTLKEAERIALQILKDVMEDKINSVNVELAVIPTETGLFQVRTQQEIQDILPLLTDPINQ